MRTLLRYSLILFAVLLTGCLSRVDADGDWEAGADKDASFDRLLIVAMSPHAGARCDFELYLRTQVRSAGTEAQASCNLMRTRDDITRESVQEAVAEYGADAVLVTLLVQTEQESMEGGSSDTRGGLDFKATGTGYSSGYYRGGYGAYGVPVVYGEFKKAPVVMTVEGEVTIRSLLYDAADASLVYEVLTEAKDLHSSADAFGTITPPIAKSLRDAGLIR